MVNKAKKQGTTYESNIVGRLDADENFRVQRLAEGGSLDKGDIELIINNEHVYYIEAKSRQNLNIHQTLDKAIEKSNSNNTVVFWKKLKRKKGNSKRTNDGVPEVVCITYELFVDLLKNIDK
jgi:Holliday junction resolvase